jgi:DNA polymerase-3 subunit alpha (Gram-positive type)
VDKDALLDRKLDDCSLVFLDIETTGLDYSKEHIIEVAAVTVRDGAELAAFGTLVKPIVRQGLFAEMVPIPKEITRITGIEGSQLEDKPPFEEIYPDLLKAFGESILVAHNAAFDISFLAFKFQSMGVPLPANPVLDTLALSRAVSPELKSHSMDALKGFYGVKAEKAHRAMDDTRALVTVFDKILDLAARKRFPQQAASTSPRKLFCLRDLQDCFKAVMPFAVVPSQLPGARGGSRR